MCSSIFSVKPKNEPIASDLSPLLAYSLKPIFKLGNFASARSSATITVAIYQVLHLSIASTLSPTFRFYRQFHSSTSDLVPRGAIRSLSIGTLNGLTWMSFTNEILTVVVFPFVSLNTSSIYPRDQQLILKLPSVLKASITMPTAKFSLHYLSSSLKFERLVLASDFPASPPRSC